MLVVGAAAGGDRTGTRWPLVGIVVGMGTPSLPFAVGALVCLAALGGGHTASVAPLHPS